MFLAPYIIYMLILLTYYDIVLNLLDTFIYYAVTLSICNYR